MYIANTVKSICEAENSNNKRYIRIAKHIVIDSRKQTAMINRVKNHLARGHGARHLEVNRKVYAKTTIESETQRR